MITCGCKQFVKRKTFPANRRSARNTLCQRYHHSTERAEYERVSSRIRGKYLKNRKDGAISCRLRLGKTGPASVSRGSRRTVRGAPCLRRPRCSAGITILPMPAILQKPDRSTYEATLAPPGGNAQSAGLIPSALRPRSCPAGSRPRRAFFVRPRSCARRRRPSRPCRRRRFSA